mgnify:CR=1 FL=1
MIGQNKLKEYFNTNTLKNFYIVQGSKGSGKSTLVKYLSKQNNMPVIQLEDLKMDSIRQLIDECQSLSVNTAYCIQDGQNLSYPCQNALLKLLEETPPKAHIFLEVSNITQILPTIKSRASVISMQPYTLEELKQCTQDKQLCNMCSNIGQIKQLEQYERKNELFKYISTIKNHIQDVSLMNVFNISKYVSLKKTDIENYPLDIVMTLLKYAFKDNYDVQKILVKHSNQFRYASINKTQSFEMMMCSIWKVRREQCASK